MIEFTAGLDSSFQMWVVFAFIGVAFVFYVFERASMEMTSVGLICALLVFFHFFPVAGPFGGNLVDPVRILHGFSNPALITVLALLVIGQGMVRTGILDHGARVILSIVKGRMGSILAMLFALIVVIVISAFLNNIPVVVIFIPIMQALSARFGQSASKWMIPLSFAAVFGGMTTLIGSGTNLLVNGALIEMGERPFGFFDFSVPGIVLASVGLIYIVLVIPRLLPDRDDASEQGLQREGKHFLAQITVGENAELIGETPVGGIFRGLPNMTVRMIFSNNQTVLPPFEDHEVKSGDVLVVAATRKALKDSLLSDPGLLYPVLEDGGHKGHMKIMSKPWEEGEQMLAEIMVVPASRLIGRTLSQVGFRYKTSCVVVGIQRRSRMIRSRITDIRLQAGDVLLVQGQPTDITGLKEYRDVVLIEWSSEELPTLDHARRSLGIFALVIALAATGTVPIVVSALCGAAAMVAFQVINIQQAFRAMDSKIVTTIAAALALGVALQETGGATYIAHGLVNAMDGQSSTAILSMFFLLVAVSANIVSSKACAVLFTPIAVDIARVIGVPPEAFALAVVFAANCSFASPLGYQTNILVMAPGGYRFIDFVKVGVPLVLLMWIVFSFFVPWYYGL
ncbi:MAG: SLC13 family permease [Rhodospirillales bacterium]|jgi:di/tricarboxylate transporter|nr:SLC13 family permease [Rhodospirillales bacterium]